MKILVRQEAFQKPEVLWKGEQGEPGMAEAVAGDYATYKGKAYYTGYYVPGTERGVDGHPEAGDIVDELVRGAVAVTLADTLDDKPDLTYMLLDV